MNLKAIKHYTTSNRKAWNEVTPIHQDHRKTNLKEDFLEKNHSVLDSLISNKLWQLPIGGKKVAHLCCNNGMETLSLVSLGAASATGFDISDEAIEEARELAAISGLNAHFVQADLYDIDEDYDDCFDLIYFSVGALTWLPELSPIFETVARMLRSGGQLLIYEMHPFLNVFPTSNDDGYESSAVAQFSYFKKTPWIDTEGIDYIGGTVYDSEPSYCFSHSLNNIMTAILNSGIRLQEFKEYSHDISSNFTHLEQSELDLPLCYILLGEKS